MIQLWFYIEGNKDVSLISISPDLTIHELKKQIYAEEYIQSIVDCGPTNLTLTKVNEDIDVVSDKIRAGLYQLDANQRQLRGHDKIFKEWPEPPPADHLHFVVTLPGGVGTSYRVGAGELPSERPTLSQTTGDRVGAGYERRIPPLPPSNTCPRRNLVSVLYEKLKTHHFILVRGTPASGKSTLARYLAHFIYEQEPATKIIFISGWNAGGDWQRYLEKKYGLVDGERTFLIFDDAQMTYQDTDLWAELFKELPSHNKQYAIAFASYGSPTSRIDITGTPIVVKDSQRVSMRHTNRDGLGIVGLLFSETEFDELVDKKFPTPPGHSFDLSFLKKIFLLSGGHVGAIYEVLQAVLAHDTYRKLKLTGEHYTWDLFMTGFSLLDLLKHLAGSSVFGRGLPRDVDLRQPSIARILTKVLITGSMVKSRAASKEEVDAIDDCYHNGWLHADKLENDENDEEVFYVLPSGLHRWFVESKLFKVTTTPLAINNILELAIKVISGFSPILLSTERRIGPGSIQRPPEAQYQDEFYRSCYEYSKGQLITFPEFGTGRGRVDFYIPSLNWGVELVREGDRLEEHSSRFARTGSYGQTLPLVEHIILDFRTTPPNRAHPYIPKLYHVVFSSFYREVVILDHLLQTVPGGEFRLLNTM